MPQGQVPSVAASWQEGAARPEHMHWTQLHQKMGNWQTDNWQLGLKLLVKHSNAGHLKLAPEYILWLWKCLLIRYDLVIIVILDYLCNILIF